MKRRSFDDDLGVFCRPQACLSRSAGQRRPASNRSHSSFPKARSSLPRRPKPVSGYTEKHHADDRCGVWCDGAGGAGAGQCGLLRHGECPSAEGPPRRQFRLYSIHVSRWRAGWQPKRRWAQSRQCTDRDGEYSTGRDPRSRLPRGFTPIGACARIRAGPAGIAAALAVFYEAELLADEAELVVFW